MTTTSGTTSLCLSEKHSFEEFSLSGYFGRFLNPGSIPGRQFFTELMTNMALVVGMSIANL
jgi:hypothetical protein